MHKIIVPLIDILLSESACAYQCEKCGWTGDKPEQRWRGRTSSISVIMCPSCGNFTDANDLIVWEIRLIPKKE